MNNKSKKNIFSRIINKLTGEETYIEEDDSSGTSGSSTTSRENQSGSIWGEPSEATEQTDKSNYERLTLRFDDQMNEAENLMKNILDPNVPEPVKAKAKQKLEKISPSAKQMATAKFDQQQQAKLQEKMQQKPEIKPGQRMHPLPRPGPGGNRNSGKKDN